MGSLDPVAGSGLAPDLAAIIADELGKLAADALTLQTRLTTGDIVSAVVLPSNGLTDLLDIGGLRVAADLPPTLVPGEHITVEVTSFAGDRINLHILPTPAAGAEPNAANVARSVVSVPARAVPALGQTAPLRQPAPLGQPAAQPALVPRATPVSAGDVAGTPGSAGKPGVDLARFAAQARPLQPVPVAAGALEARLATARATAPRSAPPSGPSGPAPRTTGGRDATTPQRQASPAALPPFISPRATVPASAVPPPSATKLTATAAPATATPAPPPPATPAARGPAAFTEPAALLRALQLPVTASNLAAARLALVSPQKLPDALASLEQALSASVDPHITTLRTLVAFLQPPDPRSPVLAEQVAAFVDHVVVGREGKLVQLLDAHAQASLPAGPVDAATAERIAFHQTALDYDLKSLLLAVVDDGPDPARSTPVATDVSGAVAKVLTAVTALQLGAAVTLAASPDGLAFALPIALPGGFAQAHVRIDRATPDARGVALDGDNFHIGFVLETHHLGVVAIDLNTVGRSVTLLLQTEAEPAQRLFGTALSGLTQRLESLRYRVTKAHTAVAPRGLELAAAGSAAGMPPAGVAPLETVRPGAVDVDA